MDLSSRALNHRDSYSIGSTDPKKLEGSHFIERSSFGDCSFEERALAFETRERVWVGRRIGRKDGRQDEENGDERGGGET